MHDTHIFNLFFNHMSWIYIYIYIYIYENIDSQKHTPH